MPDYQNQRLEDVYAGEDAVQPLTVPDTDVTGWSIRFSLAAARGDSPLLTLDTDDGVTVTDAGAGEFEVALPAAETAALAPAAPDAFRLLHWDVWRVDGGSRRQLAGGTVRVLDPVATYP